MARIPVAVPLEVADLADCVIARFSVVADPAEPDRGMPTNRILDADAVEDAEYVCE